MTLQSSSRPYAEVIGDPIIHSKSPRIHGFWLEQAGMAGEYRACHVLPGDLAGYFATRRADPAWRGCNVTIPHKEAVAPFLDHVDDHARTVGAINTVWRDDDGLLCGTNTDVDGVAEALAVRSLAGAQVCLIGAGGAARAALALLSSSACARVRVLARDVDKAARVAAECGVLPLLVPFTDPVPALAGADVVINATQLGMTGQQLMPESVLSGLGAVSSGALVFDMVYAPLETGLLARARRLGLSTSDGLTMLVGQAATAFSRFFGQAPRRINDQKLRNILTS